MASYRGTTTYVRVYEELVRAAQYRGLTTYQDVAAMMGLLMTGNKMGREVGQILNEIVVDELAADRPMLSAVVERASGGPGPGFFALARECGRHKGHVTDQAFWKSELEAVYAAWRRPLPEH